MTNIFYSGNDSLNINTHIYLKPMVMTTTYLRQESPITNKSNEKIHNGITFVLWLFMWLYVGVNYIFVVPVRIGTWLNFNDPDWEFFMTSLKQYLKTSDLAHSIYILMTQ